MNRVMLLSALALLSAAVLVSARAEVVVVGVSGSNFQQQRWQTDKGVIQTALEPANTQRSVGERLLKIRDLPVNRR